MRKLAWLTLFAAAALYLGAGESAFAHPNHFHAAPSTPVVTVEVTTPVIDHVVHADEFVSSAEIPSHKCQHGNSQSDCDVCAACSASACATIAAFDGLAREMRVRGEGLPLAAAYIVRQTILDLSRPPKSIA